MESEGSSLGPWPVSGSEGEEGKERNYKEIHLLKDKIEDKEVVLVGMGSCQVRILDLRNP